MGDGQQGHLGEVDDELPELGVAAGLRFEPGRDGLRHRLQQQRPELRHREYHLLLLRRRLPGACFLLRLRLPATCCLRNTGGIQIDGDGSYRGLHCLGLRPSLRSGAGIGRFRAGVSVLQPLCCLSTLYLSPQFPNPCSFRELS